MELIQYQAAAAATADRKAYDDAYLIPMIVGEIGELFGQVAKAHWHGWDADKLKHEKMSEYGDICWGTAILLSTRGVSHLTYTADNMFEFALTRWGNKRDAWQVLLTRSAHLHQWYSEKETHQYIKGEAEQLWLTLHQFCQAITGASFDEVLQMNLDKLASRAARGTLIGSGDHR